MSANITYYVKGLIAEERWVKVSAVTRDEAKMIAASENPGFSPREAYDGGDEQLPEIIKFLMD